jgi:hypothetical protein
MKNGTYEDYQLIERLAGPVQAPRFRATCCSC